MQQGKVGKQSISFGEGVGIKATVTVVGPMEAAGPLGQYFDHVLPDTRYGENCWEGTESKMLKEAFQTVINNALVPLEDVDLLVTSDLLDQLTASNYAVREIPINHLGVYSACAGFVEGVIVAGMALTGGFAKNAVVAVSSHHDAAERQYRFPTELGVQRPLWAQWTVTGAGAAFLEFPARDSLRVVRATIGRVVDYGVRDAYNMGSAMAPAAADTIQAHLRDFDLTADYYDLILTGDLGHVGLTVLRELLTRRGISIGRGLDDCGVMIYDRERQDVHSGGSGLGCAAAVFNSYIVKQFRQGRWKKVLLVATGALHSPVRVKQSESIPAIAHAIGVEVIGG
ncbi:MAG: stage V sporulation protein AD [Firmicutes bacterium]|nr:stage V sporulation protein AD [Bacillota bacterium]